LVDELVPPFSARNRGPHAQIDNDFPETARIGLLHLVGRLVEMKYVDGWSAIMSELRRIARVRPSDDDSADELLSQMPWERIFDFCERLHSHLAQDVTHFNRQEEHWELVAPKSQVQEFIASELQLLFIEEHLAFQFSNGLVQRREYELWWRAKSRRKCSSPLARLGKWEPHSQAQPSCRGLGGIRRAICHYLSSSVFFNRH
jgi:hypothetical protein